jgi:hypothetical protein
MGQKWARYTPLYWTLYGLGVAAHAAQPVTNTFGWMGDLAMVVPGVDEADEADEVLQGVGDAAYDASSDVSHSTEPVTTSGRIEGGPEPLANYREAPPQEPREPVDFGQDQEVVRAMGMEAGQPEVGGMMMAAREAEAEAGMDEADEEAEAEGAVEAMEATAMEIIDTQIAAMQGAGRRARARGRMMRLIWQTRRRTFLEAESPFESADLWDATLSRVRRYFRL